MQLFEQKLYFDMVRSYVHDIILWDIDFLQQMEKLLFWKIPFVTFGDAL